MCLEAVLYSRKNKTNIKALSMQGMLLSMFLLTVLQVHTLYCQVMQKPQTMFFLTWNSIKGCLPRHTLPTTTPKSLMNACSRCFKNM